MGIVTLVSFFQNGSIASEDYRKYIIPYTPVSVALIITILLMPVIIKVFKRFSMLAASVLGILLFLASEIGLEQIKVVENQNPLPLESWQYSLCVATPQVLKSIGMPIYAQYNPGYKIHFYLIAAVMILTVIYVIYGFSKMYITSDYSRKRPLVAQAISVTLFISLCIYACFTAFYRNGTIRISPLSALLMTVFFLVFGITVGIYIGTIFYQRKLLFSGIIPAGAASLTTLVMYIGELILMGGKLFLYGKGLFFQKLGILPFSAVDIGIILLSGIFTYGILSHLNAPSKK
jgi:hypothetical protein